MASANTLSAVVRCVSSGCAGGPVSSALLTVPREKSYYCPRSPERGRGCGGRAVARVRAPLAGSAATASPPLSTAIHCFRASSAPSVQPLDHKTTQHDYEQKRRKNKTLAASCPSRRVHRSSVETQSSPVARCTFVGRKSSHFCMLQITSPGEGHTDSHRSRPQNNTNSK